ncbi:hypothetical protein GCM10010353_61090 [Streptomyces chryseus]|nr:hypothetical protein GCM10010353_61090 [Streptomyces chryseus]
MEVRVLVDGWDILGDAFTESPGEEPEVVLAPGGPLSDTSQPHEVRLAEAACTECCCGALYVTVRRDGDDMTVERLLEQHLGERADRLARWECEPDAVSPGNRTRSTSSSSIQAARL